ncbi:MAG: gluconate 2-dehydrogenase subunit 3 family protein [Gemmatimonadaceae bacterium]
MPEQEFTIDRREAIRRVTALLGGTALIGGSTLMNACRNDRAPAQAGVGSFTSADVAFLDEVADTILPTTSTPGAKAAQTGAFMALMVTDTYDEKDQKIFRDGMRQLDEASQQAHNASFMASTPAQRLAVLEAVDREQKAYQDAKKKAEDDQKNDQQRNDDRRKDDPRKDDPATDRPNHYFRMMKELALLGYFTSEIGYMQAQRYVEAPGKFEPCVPYAAGERSWAPHA